MRAVEKTIANSIYPPRCEKARSEAIQISDKAGSVMPSFPQQLSLFDSRNQQALLLGGFVASMKGTIRRMLEQSGFSRAQFVDRMNAISKGIGKGKKYTLATLEKWAADGERGQLPNLLDFEIIQLAAGSMLGLETWLAMQGFGLMDEEARMKVELAEIELARPDIDKRRRQLKERLTERR